MMKRNQKGFSAIEIIIILFVALVIAGVAFYLVQNKTRVSIDNGGQSFSFDLGTPAKKISRYRGGKTTEYYQTTPKGDSTVLLATIYKPTSSTNDLKNTCRYDKVEVTILNETHTLCDQKHKAYISNFSYNDKWYQVAVFPEDLKYELPQEDVVKLVESIKSN